MRTLISSTLILCLFLSGCTSFGPTSMKQQHPSYNEAIVSSLNEQFLINLVRLRYRDNPYFLEISSVTSSQTLSVSAGVEGELRGHTGPYQMITPSVGGTLSQTPTISYAPLQGESFLRKLLSPIPLEAILVLTQSGWSIDRVFGLCVERINELDNASRASGPTPEDPPVYTEFTRLTQLLRSLQKEDLIRLGIDPGGTFPDLLMRIGSNERVAAESLEIKELLGVPASHDSFRFHDNFLKISEDQLSVRSRSIMSILFFLSHAVDVPAEDVAAGHVTRTLNSDGTPFDWDDISGRHLKVHTSKTRPDNSYVAVPYRDSWFYIEDNDLNSKSTFMLLTQLFNLQAGQTTSIAPSLTIPVGGR